MSLFLLDALINPNFYVYCETTLIKTIKYEILQIVCHTDSDRDDGLLR